MSRARGGAWLATLLVAAGLAGCIAAPEEAPATDVSAPGLVVDASRPDTSFGDVVTGPAAAPDVNATTREAPKLVRGEWWRIRFQSPYFDQVPEAVRIVADVHADGYVMGMPHSGWYKEAMAYHFPGFGDVNLDLSYDVHNERFEPLRFPLTPGATWTTHFGASDYTATVEAADTHSATIRFDPPASAAQPTDPVFGLVLPAGADGGMRMTYDARQHEIVRFESFFLRWEVVEHGYGFEGWVTVPRGMETAIDYGQFLAATPGAPVLTRTQTVAGGFNRLTLLHAVFALGPGAYRIRSTAPDGTEFVTESVAGSSFLVRFYEHANPDGEWKLEDVVLGAGGTYSMGMAYHQYDIRLPDGARRSDHAHPVVR